MSKYTPRNPMWPDWYNGKKIDEVTFCRELLHNHPMKCIDGTFQESRLFCRNRLPVAYNQKAAKPERWLAFLNELLEPEDIPTLQEYLGYCLYPLHQGAEDDVPARQGR